MIAIYLKGYWAYYKDEEEFCEYIPESVYRMVRQKGLVGFVKDKKSSILDIKEERAQRKINKIYLQKSLL